MPAHLPDHTVRVVLVPHRLAALASVERLRFDDTNCGSLPAHTERHVGIARRGGGSRRFGLGGWCRFWLSLPLPPCYQPRGLTVSQHRVRPCPSSPPPAAKASDNDDHAARVQRAAFDTRQHLAFNPCVERAIPDGEWRRSWLPSILQLRQPFLERPDARHCDYHSPRWKRGSKGMSGAPARMGGGGVTGVAGSGWGMTTGASTGAASARVRPSAAWMAGMAFRGSPLGPQCGPCIFN